MLDKENKSLKRNIIKGCVLTCEGKTSCKPNCDTLF